MAVAADDPDLINAQRTNEGYALAEERIQPGEEADLQDIINSFNAQMRRLWNPGYFERGGNTKTHRRGARRTSPSATICREHMRRGIFAEPANVSGLRYLGPRAASWTPDIDDVGFMSMAIMLMGVAGPKLLDDVTFTQDRFGTSALDVRHPQHEVQRPAPALELPERAVVLLLQLSADALSRLVHEPAVDPDADQPAGETSTSARVPYLLGEGQAMQYSFWSRLKSRSQIPNLPGRPPDNYLRDAMIATLSRQDVEFDICLQVQTDPFLMPIENAAVMWPPKVSPRVPAAVLRIPQQTFASPEQIAFARVLTYNPWHSIPEHRPLGNVSRGAQAACRTGSSRSCV